MRCRRGAVSSMNRVMKMAVRPPAVMPLLQQAAREVGQQVGEYQAVLAADADPERVARDEPLWWSMPPCTTSVMPRTKVMASTTVR